jgi:hypothetical protein
LQRDRIFALYLDGGSDDGTAEAHQRSLKLLGGHARRARRL